MARFDSWLCLAIVVCFFHSLFQSQSDAFTPLSSRRYCLHGNNSRIIRKCASRNSRIRSDADEVIIFASSATTTRLRGTIEFTGESSTSIEVPLPRSSSSSSNNNNNNNNTPEEGTLSQWMLSSDSDKFFLGTKNFRQRNDGMWDTYQPSVDWFGLELVPVFVIQLDKCPNRKQVSASITEARSDIKSGRRDSVTGKLISQVMDKSSFRGSNRVAWQEKKTSDGWILTADLSLTLLIPLPPFVPLPPGFNSIGSQIVKSTCRRRLEQFVADLQEAYLDWEREQRSASG